MFDNKFIKDRKLKRQQIKNTNNETTRDNLEKQIIQSEIDEKQDQIQKKQEELNQKKQEIKEEYYCLIQKLINTYKRLGLIKSARQINERYNKSNCYFQASQKNNNLPTFDILKSIIIDIDTIISSIDFLCDDLINKDSVVRVLQNLIERFTELKYRLALEVYKI